MNPRTDTPPADDSILGALREATRDQHARLDAALDLTGPSLSLARYVAFLRGTAAVLVPLERSLATLPGWEAALPDAPARRRAHLLAGDLRALDDATPCDEAPVPPIDSVARGFGCAYVIEGSTLGAVVLARSIEPTLGLSPARGTGYLRAYGDAVGSRWKAFLERLAAFSKELPVTERRELVATAGATFGAFEGAFRRAGAAR